MIASQKSIRRINTPRVIRSGSNAPVLYGPNGKPIRREHERNENVEMFHVVGDEDEMSALLRERGGRGMQHLMEDLRNKVSGTVPHADAHYKKTTEEEPMQFIRNGGQVVEFFQRIG